MRNRFNDQKNLFVHMQAYVNEKTIDYTSIAEDKIIEKELMLRINVN